MNKKISLALFFLCATIFSYAQTFSSKTDSAAYANGYQTGAYFQYHQININVEAFVAGILDAYQAKQPKIDKNQINELGQYFNTYVQQALNEKQKSEIQYNKNISANIMAENKKNPNIKETASGLQYQVLKENKKGKKPLATDKVKVHYKGYLHNGVVFDSSIDRGEPVTFALNQVIKGWTEGLQLMTVGSKYKFWIPSDLAYGDRAVGNDIPAGSMLIFEVELLDINPQ
ncbi:MAG: FKBP-type peptidyl-prolyl cis-trans isomerase [Bacteroidales bacterium]|nr:FKBP-type peptidyl-prolyl cis-trans isomerase [Bacteroidales bacterium]